MNKGQPSEPAFTFEKQAADYVALLRIIFNLVQSQEALAKAAKLVRPSLKLLFTSGFTAAPVVADEFRSNLLSKPYSKRDLAQYIRGALDSPF